MVKRKIIFSTSSLLLTLILFAPVFTFAATPAGLTPKSPFYFLDKLSEKISLFFTFDPGKKTEKILTNADERLAEAEAVAEEKNIDAVKTAITGYVDNIALATEKFKDIKDQEKAEKMLTSIADNTSKNQEILTDILAKVPQEAKEAITKAIEVIKKGQDEALKQIATLKQEVSKLKQEITELKKQQKIESTAPTNTQNQSDIKELKKEIEELKKQALMPETPSILEPTTSIPATTPATPEIPTTSPISESQTLEMGVVYVTPSLNSARIEWRTNIPTNSKLFLHGRVYSSESGLSTRHIVNVADLTSGTNYLYDIEAINGDQFAQKQGSFTTKPDDLILSLQVDKTSVPLTNWHSVKITAQFTKNGKLVPVDISFSAPDSSKTYIVFSSSDPKSWPIGTNSNPCGNNPFLIQPAGNSGGSCSIDAKVNFEYQPKSLGTHTITATASGITKTIDIQAVEYVRIDPKFEKSFVYQQDINNSSYPVEIPEYPLGHQDATIVNFNLSDVDEPFTLDEIKIESDISTSKFRLPRSSGSGSLHQIKIDNTADIPVGTHTLTIKEIKVIGQKSGWYRIVSGLPVTLTFKIKEEISYDVQSVIPYKSQGQTIFVGNVDVWYLMHNKTSKSLIVKKIKARITTSDSTPKIFEIETAGAQQNVVIAPISSDQAGKLSFNNSYETILGPLKIETITIETDSVVPVTGKNEIIKYLP